MKGQDCLLWGRWKWPGGFYCTALQSLGVGLCWELRIHGAERSSVESKTLLLAPCQKYERYQFMKASLTRKYYLQVVGLKAVQPAKRK